MATVFATLLDFDGVLVDSEPVHLAAFNDVLAADGIEITVREYVDHYLSLDDVGVFRAALARNGRAPSDEHVRSLVAAKSPRFLARFETQFRVFPGAEELIARRSSRGPVGIVSGALEREISFALERMGVGSYVAFIVSAERSVPGKPDPLPYRLAREELTRLGYAGPSVAVEDSAGGVASASHAGVRCVAVTHSCSREDLVRAGAAAVVPDLASLTDALLEVGR
jgi:beta-phosphoglucomutase-like phosphatase (HAD superfamily)